MGYERLVARRGLVAWVCVGVFVVVVAWTRAQWGGPMAMRAAVDLSTTAAALAAAGLCLARAAPQPRPNSTAWRLLGLACLSWGLGNVVWTWYELGQDEEVPFPSLADVGYLLLLPLATAALLAMMRGRASATTRLRALLDGVVFASSVLFIALVFYLRPLFEYGQATTSVAGLVVLLAYPVGDVILLSLLVLLATRAPPPLRHTLWWLGLALLLLAYADFGFWYLVSTDQYHTGSPFDAGWLGAFLVLCYAAVRPIPAAGQAKPMLADRPGPIASAAPLVPFAIATAVAVYAQVSEGRLVPPVFWLGITNVGLLILRQFVMLQENIGLRRHVERERDLLEVRVQERTRELSDAKVAAEKASMAKSIFLSTMSHEIRTPLHAIIAMSSTMQQDKSADKDRDALGTIRVSGEHLLYVLNNVLDYSKIESGRMPVEPVPMDPVGVAREAVQFERANAASKGLEVKLDVAPAVPPAVLVDPNRLRQVLLNLLDNAIKFTDRGAVTLAIQSDKADGVPTLSFRVQDTGIGIPPEVQARLFQPFMQAEEGSKRAFGGSGLGLAICKRLVEMMGSTIAIESKLGAGSTFSFTIPAPPAPAVAPSAATPPPSQAPVELSKLRILLAEDNAVNQKVAVFMLSQLGCRADMASDGQQTVEAVRRQPYDVVLMDLHMPTMDGWEATAAIMSDWRVGKPRPRIVAMTADAMVEDRKRCLDAGMDDYLGKPVRTADLKAALERMAHAGPPPNQAQALKPPA